MQKKLIQRLIGKIQEVLIYVFLVQIYLLGFGMTFIFVLITKRSLLVRKNSATNTFWIQADGYGPDMNDCLRQS